MDVRPAGEAVKLAAELVRRFDAQLVLLSAYKDAGGAAASSTRDEELEWATNAAARQRETIARTEERLRQDGVPCRTLIAEEEPADVPNTVTHKAGCSVLVLKTA